MTNNIILYVAIVIFFTAAVAELFLCDPQLLLGSVLCFHSASAENVEVNIRIVCTGTIVFMARNFCRNQEPGLVTVCTCLHNHDCGCICMPFKNYS